MKAVFILILSIFFSTIASAEKIKIDVKTDTIAIRGLAWGLEYMVDAKAKVCLARMENGPAVSIANVSCDELIKAYPELSTKVSWK